MLIDDGIARVVASRIAVIGYDIAVRHAAGEIQQEPAVTSRLAERIAHEINSLSLPGVVWTATELTDRGAGAQEHEFGADLLGVLHITGPGVDLRKGFLAQAKSMQTPTSMTDLREQCDKMLQQTPDAFVFLYTPVGIVVTPAISISSSAFELDEIGWHSLESFFFAHLTCLVGDRKFHAASRATLEGLAAEYDAENAILIEAVIER